MDESRKYDSHFRSPLPPQRRSRRSVVRMIMQYVIRDLEDHELGRADDARSAWDLIEVQWSPDAAAVAIDGTMVRGWMRFASLLEAAGEVVIVCYGRHVGGVAVEDW